MEITFDRKKINYIMLDRGISTQDELAQLVGASSNSISSWLAGGTFTSTTLGKFCEALGVMGDDILDYGPPATAPANGAEVER